MTSPRAALLTEAEQIRDILPLVARYEGNLGLMKFRDRGTWTQAMFLGASYMIADEIRDLVRESFYNAWLAKVVELQEKTSPKASKTYKIFVQKLQMFDGENAEVFSPYFEAPARDRNHDSEFLLVNALQHYIGRRSLSNVTDVELITELPPCNSCSKVIERFLNNNPRTSIRLYHILPSKSGNKNLAHPRFRMNLLASSIPPSRPNKMVLGLARAYEPLYRNRSHFGLPTSSSMGQRQVTHKQL